MRLKADSLWLGLVEWGVEVSRWPPKPVKQNISQHRGRQEDKRVGSVAAVRSPPCKLTLSQPVDEGRLAYQWWLAPAAHWRPAGAMFVGLEYMLDSAQIIPGVIQLFPPYINYNENAAW